MDVRAFGPAGQGYDDSIIVQQALDAIVANGFGGELTLPPGAYNFEAPVFIGGNNLTIEGKGLNATTLNYRGEGALFRNSDTTQIRRRFTMRDLRIDNGGVGTAGGIRFENFYDSLVERCQFENPGASGGLAIEFYGTGSTYLNSCFKCYFNLTVAGGKGLKWTAGAAHPNSERILDCYFNCVSGAIALDMTDLSSTANHIISNEFNLAGGTPIVIGGSHTSYIGNQHDGTASTISVSGNYNRFASNTNAGVMTWSDTGTNNQFAEDRFIQIAGSVTFDDTEPGYIYFYVPSFTGFAFGVPAALINTHFREFWAPAKDAAGSGTLTSNSGGASTSGADHTHVHPMFLWQSNTPAAGTAVRKYWDSSAGGTNINIDTSAANDLFSLAEAAPGHNHSTPNHTHTVPGHTHNLTFGIFKETFPGSHSVDVLVQQFSGGSWTTVQTISNITADSDLGRSIAAGITAAGEYRLRFLSDAAQPNSGRLVADVSGYVQIRMVN